MKLELYGGYFPKVSLLRLEGGGEAKISLEEEGNVHRMNRGWQKMRRPDGDTAQTGASSSAFHLHPKLPEHHPTMAARTQLPIHLQSIPSVDNRPHAPEAYPQRHCYA